MSNPETARRRFAVTASRDTWRSYGLRAGFRSGAGGGGPERILIRVPGFWQLAIWHDLDAQRIKSLLQGSRSAGVDGRHSKHWSSMPGTSH